MVVHPHDPEPFYIVPVESDEYRCTPEAKLRVYRTRNGGASWEPLTRGLPQKMPWKPSCVILLPPTRAIQQASISAPEAERFMAQTTMENPGS